MYIAHYVTIQAIQNESSDFKMTNIFKNKHIFLKINDTE